MKNRCNCCDMPISNGSDGLETKLANGRTVVRHRNCGECIISLRNRLDESESELTALKNKVEQLEAYWPVG